MPPRVVITDLSHADIEPELEVLAQIGANVEWQDCRTEEDVIWGAADADALLVGWAPITRRVLEALPRCRIVSRYGIGVEMIDVEAATDLGIPVTNVPDYCVEEVADHALALLLACARKLVRLDRAVRDGSAVSGQSWNTVAIAGPLHRLRGQTLGLVGLGQIGRRLAARAQACGLRLIAATDPAVSHEEAAALGITMLPLEQVLCQADYLSMHVPLTAQTHHLIDAERLALLKPTAVIINTSRGPVLDEAALVAALQRGSLGGAGLDVYEREPIAPDHPLLAFENVVLSSHAAWYSEEALYEMKAGAAQAIVDWFEGRIPRSVLNPAVLTRSATMQLRTGSAPEPGH